jgi:subtilisin-like proprotein convertase family protein/uncharacterized protein YvpB
MTIKSHTITCPLLILVFCLLTLFLVSLPALAKSPIINTPTGDFNRTIEMTSTEIKISPSNVYISTPTPPISSTIISTPTQLTTSNYIPTSSIDPSPISSYTEASTLLSTQFSYLPNLLKDFFIPTNTPTPTPLPPETVLFCDSLNQPLYIPDNYDPGVNDDINISDERLLTDIRLYLNIDHTYVGDLVVTLSNLATQHTVTAINRPGPSQYHCNYNNIITILGDTAVQQVDDKCASYPQAISGIYLPSESFSVFTGQTVNGTWRLNVSDHYVNDTGALNHWCLEAKIADTMPAPTPSPTPVNLPPSAYVAGMSGQDQQLELDCEARSAVDWAKHYGFNLDEIHFLNHLPRSDDPEVGFVGDPDGNWGNIPPNDYGVHAPPVAGVLRDYGLSASAFKSLSWDDLRAQIASGDPVIVWIIGDNSFNIVNGTPHYYIASSTGNLTIVAPHEHTVILIGYSPSDVTVLNGSRFMDIPIIQFLDSWSVLDFMAVINPQ